MNNLRNKSFSVGLMVLLTLMASLSVQGDLAAGWKAQKININTASHAELQELPRIGEVVAQRIIEFREKNGKFNKIEEIMKVRGVGEKIFENIKDLISVGSEK